MKRRSQTCSSKPVKQSKHAKTGVSSQHAKGRTHKHETKKVTSSPKNNHSADFRTKQTTNIKRDMVEDYILVNDNFYMANTHTERQEYKDYLTKYRSEIGAKKLGKRRAHAHEHLSSNIYRNNVIVKNNNIYIQNRQEKAAVQQQQQDPPHNIESYVQTLTLSEKMSFMKQLEQDFRANNPEFYAATQHSRDSEPDFDLLTREKHERRIPERHNGGIPRKHEATNSYGDNDGNGRDFNIDNKLLDLEREFPLSRLRGRKVERVEESQIELTGKDNPLSTATDSRPKPGNLFCNLALNPPGSKLVVLQRKLAEMRAEIVCENQERVNQIVEDNGKSEEQKKQMIYECNKRRDRKLNAISFAEELYESVMNTERQIEGSDAENSPHLETSYAEAHQYRNKFTYPSLPLSSLSRANASKGVRPNNQKYLQLIDQLGQHSGREEDRIKYFAKRSIIRKGELQVQDESQLIANNQESSLKSSAEFDRFEDLRHRRRFDEIAPTCKSYELNDFENSKQSDIKIDQQPAEWEDAQGETQQQGAQSEEQVEDRDQVESQLTQQQEVVNQVENHHLSKLDENQLLLTSQPSSTTGKNIIMADSRSWDKKSTQPPEVGHEQNLGPKGGHDQNLSFTDPSVTGHQMQSLLMCSEQSSLKSKIRIPLLLTKEKVEELQLQKRQKNTGRMRSEIQKKVSFQMSEFEYEEDQHHFTTLADINSYIVGLYEYIMKIDMEKVVERLNLPYGKSVRDKIYTMQQQKLSRQAADYEEAIEYYPVLDESYYHQFSKQMSFTVRRIREEEKIHNRAVFDCFSFHLNAYRPYYELEGEVYPWSVSEKGITFYEISQENIEQVFEKTKIKVLEYCSSLCGLLPRDIDPKQCPEVIDQKNRESAAKEQKQTLVQEFPKWSIKLINDDTMIRLIVSQEIVTSLMEECVQEMQSTSNHEAMTDSSQDR